MPVDFILCLEKRAPLLVALDFERLDPLLAIVSPQASVGGGGVAGFLDLAVQLLAGSTADGQGSCRKPLAIVVRESSPPPNLS